MKCRHTSATTCCSLKCQNYSQTFSLFVSPFIEENLELVVSGVRLSEILLGGGEAANWIQWNRKVHSVPI